MSVRITTQAAATLLAAVLVTTACGNGDETDTVGSQGTEASESVATTSAEPGVVSHELFALDRDGTLFAVDATSGETDELATVTNASFLWVAQGRVWVGHRERMILFGASGDELGDVPFWGPQALAAGPEGQIWIVSLGETTPTGFLSRVEGLEVTGSLETESSSFFDDVAVAGGSVWVTYDGLEFDASISRVDPDSVALVETIELEIVPEQLAADDDSGLLWIIGPRVDDETLALVSIDPDGNVSPAMTAPGVANWNEIGVGFGSLWLLDATGTDLVRIDPSTGAELERIAVGPSFDRDPRRPTIHIGGASVWIENPADDRVYQIDPTTNEVIGGFAHRAIAFGFR